MVGGPGYWQLLQGGDLHANGDYCRVAYHNEVSLDKLSSHNQTPRDSRN